MITINSEPDTASAAPLATLRKREHPVEGWLEQLEDRKRSSLLAYTASERSPVLSFLYASLLGFDGQPDEWESWVFQRCDKLDTRSLLEAEIDKLREDIGTLRELVDEGKARAGDMSNRIAFLSRELRGHIDSLDKQTTVHDRRALLLAGVEIASKMLRKVYGGNAQVWPAIEACLMAAFSEVDTKQRAK